MNYLQLSLSPQEISKISTLSLAHIGDGVFEIMTRSMILSKGALKVNNLHKATTNIVKAKSQAQMCEKIIDIITEEEKSVFMRGRNSKPHIIPKSATKAEYAKATALEALFGFLYLNARYDRLNELYGILISDIL